MEQLNGFDYYFVASEQRRTPMHISHMRIYDPGTASKDVVRFKDILKTFEERLHLAPLFRKQLVRVPMGLDYPYWIESPDFNIETHVRHIALPQPGDWRQLSILVARLHAQPLNFRLPLWEAYVIEGLDNVEGAPKGAFAVLIKAHHAIADGKSFDNMLESIHDPEPAPKKIKQSFWKPEPVPTNMELMLNTFGNYVKQPAKTVNRLQRLRGSIQRGKKYLEKNPNHAEKQQELTHFNTSVTPNKVFGAVLADIDELKSIKNSVAGATLNDVILAVTSFSVSAYLAHHDKSVDEPLRVGFPMETRSISDYSDGYNNAAPMFQSTHTDIEDPLNRLAAIHESSLQSKAYLESIGPDRMRNIFDAVPSFALQWGFGLAGRYELMADQVTGFHYFVTNVPGPRADRYLAGAKTICSFGLAPISDSTGLIHVASSYTDKVSISFQSCREMMPDPEFYQQCLQDALDLMLKAAASNTSASKRTGKRSAKMAASA